MNSASRTAQRAPTASAPIDEQPAQQQAEERQPGRRARGRRRRTRARCHEQRDRRQRRRRVSHAQIVRRERRPPGRSPPTHGERAHAAGARWSRPRSGRQSRRPRRVRPAFGPTVRHAGSGPLRAVTRTGLTSPGRPLGPAVARSGCRVCAAVVLGRGPLPARPPPGHLACARRGSTRATAVVRLGGVNPRRTARLRSTTSRWSSLVADLRFPGRKARRPRPASGSAPVIGRASAGTTTVPVARGARRRLGQHLGGGLAELGLGPAHHPRLERELRGARSDPRSPSAVASSTSPARTGARNCTSAYDANRPSSPSVRMHSSVATSPNSPSTYAPSTRSPP